MSMTVDFDGSGHSQTEGDFINQVISSYEFEMKPGQSLFPELNGLFSQKFIKKGQEKMLTFYIYEKDFFHIKNDFYEFYEIK